MFWRWISFVGLFDRGVVGDVHSYNTQSIKEIINKPERAPEYTFHLTHIEIDVIAVCFAEEECDVWVVGVDYVHVVDVLG